MLGLVGFTQTHTQAHSHGHLHLLISRKNTHRLVLGLGSHVLGLDVAALNLDLTQLGHHLCDDAGGALVCAGDDLCEGV